MLPFNNWIEARMETVRDYFTDLVDVSDPEEALSVSLLLSV
jgi:hypothetical protein